MATGRAATVPTDGPATVLQRTSDTPLWTQLRDDLRRRLDTGEFTGPFPGEHALAAGYDVSRATVRQALAQLRAEGLVTAARGRAPRVADTADVRQPLGALYSLFASVEATGLAQRSIVATLDVRVDAVVAVRLGLAESTPLVHLERLRLAGGEPLAVDRVWLPAHLATPLLEVDFGHTALYDECARRCGIRVTGGREHLRAVVPTPAERARLGCGPDVAAFAIERLGCRDGQPVEWRHTLVRGDRFSVTADLTAWTGHHVDPTGGARGVDGRAPGERATAAAPGATAGDQGTVG